MCHVILCCMQATQGFDVNDLAPDDHYFRDFDAAVDRIERNLGVCFESDARNNHVYCPLPNTPNSQLYICK